jgi:cytoskeletal protein CcmA (bactofilin family)
MAKEVVVNSGASHNVLAHGSKVKGNISADSDFRIDGLVQGEITCSGKVIIGTKGRLEGNITCVNAEIMGEVKGNVSVSDTLSLKASSNVVGDIKTKILIIEPDAVFCGSCDMGTAASAGPFIVSEENE